MDAYLQLGDPVMDAAQGRPMVVVAPVTETVAEYSKREGYDLSGNYSNQKFGVSQDEPVVECVYVSDVRSEPSKTYSFPASRVRLIDVHHADDGARLYDRVARDVLVTLLGYLTDDERQYVKQAAEVSNLSAETVQAAMELADVEERFGADNE